MGVSVPKGTVPYKAMCWAHIPLHSRYQKNNAVDSHRSRSTHLGAFPATVSASWPGHGETSRPRLRYPLVSSNMAGWKIPLKKVVSIGKSWEIMENIPNMEKMWFQLENHRTKSTKLCSCRTLCYQRVYHPSNQHPPCQLWGWKTIQLRTHPQKTLYHHRRISQIELTRVKMKQRTTYIHIIKYIIRYIYYNIIYIYVYYKQLGLSSKVGMNTIKHYDHCCPCGPFASPLDGYHM